LVVEEEEMKSFTGCCPLEDLSRVCTPSHHLINVRPVSFLPLLGTSEREAYMTLPLVRCEYLLS
jgi:hypothetical protein